MPPRVTLHLHAVLSTLWMPRRDSNPHIKIQSLQSSPLNDRAIKIAIQESNLIIHHDIWEIPNMLDSN